MKNHKLAVIAFFALAVLVSCKKDESKNLVDSYSPKLTEAKGTKYDADDYFPMNNFLWEYYEEANTIGSYSDKMGGETDSDKWDDDYSGIVTTTANDVETIVVGKDSFIASSFSTMTVATDYDNHYYNDEPDYYYFYKGDDIYRVMKGLSTNYSYNNTYTGDDIEFFMKSEIVVGDSWEVDNVLKSVFEATDQESLSNIKVTGKAKVFVLGLTQKKINGVNEEVLKIEMVADVFLSASYKYESEYYGTDVGSGTASISGTETIYLKKDVGIVCKEFVFSTTSKSSGKYEGESYTTSRNDDTKGIQELSNYNNSWGSSSWKNAEKKDKNKGVVKPVKGLRNLPNKLIFTLW